MKAFLLVATFAVFLAHAQADDDPCPNNWGAWSTCSGCDRYRKRKCLLDKTIVDQGRRCLIDPCGCHIEINDEQRSTGHFIDQNSQQFKCDLRMRSTWYQFTSGAGGEMPTTAPKLNACGAKRSVWLDGTNPTKVGEIKTVKTAVVCKGCYTKPWDVKIKKCKDEEDDKEFFIYNLPAVPRCPMVYCAGSETRCKDGFISPNGFTPGCTDNYPKTKVPTIDIKLVNNKIRLICKVDSTDTSASVRHQVEFYQGNELVEGLYGKLVATKILAGTENEAFAENSQTNPLFSLSNEFYCQVFSYYDNLLNITGKSNPQRSTFKFAGIKVEPASLTFKKTDEVHSIRIYSTIDIGYIEDWPQGCPITVLFYESNDVAIPTDCQKCFNRTGEYVGKENAWELKVRRTDFNNGKKETMFIRIDVSPDLMDWERSQHEVAIHIEKAPAKKCSATGDPHITTFDGLYYHVYHAGDYVMMGTEYGRVEVHMRTFQCGTSVTCICGIAIRYGDDVIILDTCRGGLTPKFPSKKKLNPAMKIIQLKGYNGLYYDIVTPDGVTIEFRGHLSGGWNPSYCNVYIKTPSDYQNRTFGLCGNTNGKKDDELMSKDEETVFKSYENVIASLEYTNEWKLGPGDSLFFFTPDQVDCARSRKKFCRCKSGSEIECNEVVKNVPKWTENGVEVHPDDGVIDGCQPVQDDASENNQKRKRRSNPNILIVPSDDEEPYTYKPPQVNITSDPKFPTKSGTTEQVAYNECNIAITQSTFGKACLRMYPDMDFTTLVDECVLDIKITDDIKASTSSAQNSFTALCKFVVIEEFTKNSTSTPQNNNGTKANSTTTDKDAGPPVFIPPPILVENLCPNDCSGQGACVNSTCICNANFTSTDCSMEKGLPPTVRGISNGGLCDIRKRDCLRARIIGFNFLDTDNLKSRSTKIDLTDTGYIKTNDIDYHDAYLLSISELVVEIPENDLKISGDIDGSPGKPMDGFSIAMSNDGIKYSTNESIFIVYDSKCLQCNANRIPICVRKNDSCNINGYCFNAGQDYPNNWCKMCDPSTNSFVNKTLKENSPPTFKNKTNQVVITNQVNHYVILAEDPERKNQITYSIVGESNGFAISSNSGLLSYKPNEIGETRVTIRATDICGAFTDKEFTFEALKCPCEGLNGGSCRFNETDRMQLECVCPQGCTGEKCDQPLPGETCKIEKDNEKNKGNAGDVAKSTDLALILGPVFGVVFLVPLMIALYLCCRSKKQKRVINDPSNMRMKKMSLIVETIEGTSASGKVTPVEGIDNKSMKKED